MNTIITTNTELAQDSVVDEFQSVMLARGHLPSTGDLSFANLITAAWQSQQPLCEPVVFAAECGFGKSTLLELFLRHKTETDPLFGAIVVKQKKDEVEALVNAINRNQSDDGREQVRYKRAFAIRGYDPLRMQYRSYRNQFRYQAYFPVVVMTAEMFARQSTMKLLDRFSSFYDGDKIRRPRRLLLIDERPIITRNHSMSVDDINRLIEEVREVTYRRRNAGDTEHYREFLDHAQRLRYELEACEGKRRIESIDFNYILPDELRRDWGDLYEGEDFDSLLTFESTIRFGGTVSLRKGGVPVIAVSHRIYYEWTQYNPFILDATAKTDPYYASEAFNIIEAPQPHLYRNVQFNVCSKENLSKSFIETHPQSIEETAKMVTDIVA